MSHPTVSAADTAALVRVLEALRQDQDLIHSAGLQALRRWAEEHGAYFPPAAAPAAAEVEDEEEYEEEASEPDEERWTLEDAAADNIPESDAEPTDEAMDAASALKAEAVDLAGSGDYAGAIERLTQALRQTPSNAMYWGLRALYQLKAQRPGAALQDADRTLRYNPQNVRALRVRGTVLRHTGDWEESLKALSAAQAIDYDDATNDTMRFVQARMSALHQREIRRQQAAGEAQRRRQEALRRQREAEQRKPHPAAGGMPGGMPGGMGGMPGGMGGMPGGMEALLQDPEIMAMMQDPEVAPKLMELMQNPMAAMSMMNDPKMGPALQKLMSKMMGGGGGRGAGGSPGAGGFPGAGGAGGFPTSGGDKKNDDLD